MKAEKKSAITLRISDVSVATLEAIESLGNAQRPPSARNATILFILDEVAAGRNPLDSLTVPQPMPAAA